MSVRDRRQLANLVQKPTAQYKHAVLIFGFVVFAAVIVQVVLVNSMQRIMVDTMLASGVDPLRLQVALGDQLRAYSVRVALIFPLLGLGAMFLALRMTHRFLGPQVPMRRHMSALIEGNYSSRCSIRKSDELQELARDLNELAESLQQRHEATGPQVVEPSADQQDAGDPVAA